MKIIGHRGAAGLALENTIDSIRVAIKTGVDAVEFDIRVTKDKKLVLCHDPSLGEVSDSALNIPESTQAELTKILLKNGETIATLAQAFQAASATPLVIEGKESAWARLLADFLKNHPHYPGVSVISFNHQELYTFSLLMPNVRVYALEHTSPFEVIMTAHLMGFGGIDLNFWILNPLTYLMARYHKLEIIVYTLDKPWIARFLRILYPKITITTNYPDKLQFLRRKKRRAR